MAHFAQIDNEGVVTGVVVINNADVGDLPFPDSEPIGKAFLATLYPETFWVQTSYNNNFRKRYAGIGYTFHKELDGFSSPKQYPSFVFDADAIEWVAPIAYPNDGIRYTWDEATVSWVAVRVIRKRKQG